MKVKRSHHRWLPMNARRWNTTGGRPGLKEERRVGSRRRLACARLFFHALARDMIGTTAAALQPPLPTAVASTPGSITSGDPSVLAMGAPGGVVSLVVPPRSENDPSSTGPRDQVDAPS